MSSKTELKIILQEVFNHDQRAKTAKGRMVLAGMLQK
jgi:hypothetical protein